MHFTNVFDAAFYVAYILNNASQITSLAFAQHVEASTEGADFSVIDLADWFTAWCSEDAVEAELVAV